MFPLFALLASALWAAPALAATTTAAPLPAYALSYAPISYLYSGESYFPSDVAVHLAATVPEIDRVAVGAVGSATLATLNGTYNSSVYLSTPDGPPSSVADSPAWLLSDYGIPDADGYSAAPGLVIAAEKNASTTDVFYFYFYSYNYGAPVLDINFDDHVGDWEHVMIRFVDEQPYAIYLSQHGAGSAYYWGVLQNSTSDGGTQRPVTYIASGGHANYATAGSQDYTIAGALISDTTDAGYAWDMALNYRGYWYDVSTGVFTPAGNTTGTNGTVEDDGDADWLLWEGRWGDEQEPDAYAGQYCLFDECRFASGPTGPVDKNLGRTTVCEDDDACTIFDSIGDLTTQSRRKRGSVVGDLAG